MAKSRPPGGQRWRIVQQHDNFEIVQAAERPLTTIEKGQRMKHVWGSFATKEEADAKSEEIYDRTLRGSHEKAAR